MMHQVVILTAFALAACGAGRGLPQPDTRRHAAPRPSLEPTAEQPPAQPGAVAACLVPVTKLELNQRIHFKQNSHAVEHSARAILDDVASVLMQVPQIASVQIRGYRAGSEPRSATPELSASRAKAVLQYLVSRGIASERLKAMGLGEAPPDPATSPTLAAASARRVDFAIVGFHVSAVPEATVRVCKCAKRHRPPGQSAGPALAPPGPRATASAEEAPPLAALRQARLDFQAGRLEHAAAQLQALVDRTPMLEPRIRAVAYEILGAALALLDRREAARNAFDALLALEPSWQMDQADYPMTVVELFLHVLQQRQQLLGCPIRGAGGAVHPAPR